MFAFIGWLIVGLIAGAIARFLIPGPQPMTLFWTMLLGLAGSFLGGFLYSLSFGTNLNEPNFQAAGLLWSVVGALVILGLYVFSMTNRAVPR